MAQIDLDDLPPKIAQTLAGLQADEELLLVQGGAAVDDTGPEEGMKEVMEQFNAMIHDEF